MLAADPALLETLHPDKLLPSTDAVPERFELGTLPYELLAGVTAAVDFIAGLVPGDGRERRGGVLESMPRVEELRGRLFERLLAGLDAIDGVRRTAAPPGVRRRCCSRSTGRTGREVHERSGARAG